MKLKKMLLLTTMALAVVASAAPAAAHAEQHEFNEATESYEGPFKFSAAGVGSIECQVTINISAEGGTTAEVEAWTPTTSTCVGTGAFAKCTLKEHTSNAPFTVHTTETNDLRVTKEGGNITFHNIYDGEGCLVPETTVEFTEMTATPNPTTGAVSTLTISATSTTGVIWSGTFHAEGESLIELG
jgi:hypothetical protein